MFDFADQQDTRLNVLQRTNIWSMEDLIGRQTDLAFYPLVDYFQTPETDLAARADSNSEIWSQFFTDELYDTRRVTLEHFHLFEWFPLSPGTYHTRDAARHRHQAKHSLKDGPDGKSYYDQYGKAEMIRGGFGAVRLRPRSINAEPHYFMSASSSGTCHEGFPVLIPREIYRNLIPRIKREGAVPVTLSGEMCHPTLDLPTFLGGQRPIPHVYLHVDHFDILPRPREAVTSYYVSGAVSFKGQFQEEPGIFVTFATFDPASQASLEQACQWIEKFYVQEQHHGEVITDFDEKPPRPRFENATFGLPRLMAGTLEFAEVSALLQDLDIRFNEQNIQVYLDQSRKINTMGGAYIEGDLDTGGGNFVGRDQVVSPPDQNS